MDRCREHRWALGMSVAMFVVSRVVAYAAGVRFDPAVLSDGVWILDTVALRDDLWRSIWYLHAQPPLFNLFLGLGLHLSPISAAATFGPVWLALGAGLVVIVFALLRDLGVHPVAVGIGTVLVTANPVTILYENHLSYEYPLAVALTGLALCALRWVRTGRWGWLAGAAALAGAGVLSRALLHPLWYGLVAAALVLARRPTTRRVTAWSVLLAPLVLAGLVIAKNAVLFDSPQLSSLTGWNLSRVTVDELPADVKDRLIAEGTLTPQARLGSLLDLEVYAPLAPPCTPAHPDVAVLARSHKANGIVNLNAECYLPRSAEAMADAVAAARAEPARTGRAVVGAFEVWGLPASEYFLLYDNRAHILGWDTLYRRTVLLDVAYDPPVPTHAAWWIPFRAPDHRWRFSLTIAAATLAALAAGTRASLRLVRRCRRPPPAPGSAAAARVGVDTALAVIGLTVAVVTLIGNLFEIGENNRFRFLVEPVTLVVMVWVADRTARRLRAAWARRRTAEPDDGAVIDLRDPDPDRVPAE